MLLLSLHFNVNVVGRGISFVFKIPLTYQYLITKCLEMQLSSYINKNSSVNITWHFWEFFL